MYCQRNICQLLMIVLIHQWYLALKTPLLRQTLICSTQRFRLCYVHVSIILSTKWFLISKVSFFVCFYYCFGDGDFNSKFFFLDNRVTQVSICFTDDIECAEFWARLFGTNVPRKRDFRVRGKELWIPSTNSVKWWISISRRRVSC